MIAMVDGFSGPRYFAAIAEVAAVRRAVRMVISDRSSGYPVCDISQNTERGYRLPALLHVLGMAVHIFETVDFAIAGRHQFDHTFIAVGGDARGLVEQFPAAEIGFDFIGQFNLRNVSRPT